MSTRSDDGDSVALREAMIERDLKARGIRSVVVLRAFRSVPREPFVPPRDQGNAYADHPLSIGHGQTISQPYMVALMTQELEVNPGHRVLEVGTGSGYQTAILASLGAEVFTVERVADLGETARRRLEDAGFADLHYRVADGTLGWPEEAPFDRIMVTAGAPQIPQSLIDQLADGGRMVIPVGPRSHQDLLCVTRKGDRVQERYVCGCVFVKLVGREGWEG